MPLVYTEFNDWIEACESEARLSEFSRGEDNSTHPHIDRAETRAAEEMLGYLSKRYGTAPLDNLTMLTKGHLLNLGLWYLTDFAENRPNNITDNAIATRTWLEKVSKGTFTLKELVGPAPSEKAEGLSGVLLSSPVFSNGAVTQQDWDRDNPMSLSSIKLGRPL